MGNIQTYKNIISDLKNKTVDNILIKHVDIIDNQNKLINVNLISFLIRILYYMYVYLIKFLNMFENIYQCENAKQNIKIIFDHFLSGINNKYKKISIEFGDNVTIKTIIFDDKCSITNIINSVNNI